MSHRRTGWEGPAEVLDLHDAAHLLRISERHLWRLAREGKVPHKRLGTLYRFHRDELLDYMRKEGTSNG